MSTQLAYQGRLTGNHAGQLILEGLNIFAQKFFSETTEQCEIAGLDPLPEFELLIAANNLKKGTASLQVVRSLWRRIRGSSPPRIRTKRGA